MPFIACNPTFCSPSWLATGCFPVTLSWRRFVSRLWIVHGVFVVALVITGDFWVSHARMMSLSSCVRLYY